MLNEESLINNKEERDKYIDRINVLEQVKNIITLPNTAKLTTTQVAKYFNVDNTTIENYYKSKKFKSLKEELIGDGLKLEKYSEIIDMTGLDYKTLLSNGFKISKRGSYIFTKRCILRIAMVMRNNSIAKEVRTRLLDIIHDTEKNNPKIINNIINEIRDEQQIQKELIEAVMCGDFAKETQLKTELIGLKNKRITELEKENKLRSDNATLIQDTRLIINRIVRYITNKRYHGNFKACWDYVYTLANYKLHMNIKKREHKKNEPLLNTLTYEELQKLEIMLRNWCLDLNYNLESILRLS